jgi:hypothetical protein
MAAMNVAVPEERPGMELPTANIAPDVPLTDKSLIPEAIDAYDLAARLSGDAITEYERHLRSYSISLQTYESHMESIRAQRPLLLADRDYLKAMLASGAQRTELLAAAAKNYRDSIKGNLQVIFHYYIPEPVAQAVLPPGVTRSDISAVPLDQLLPMYGRAMQLIATMPYDADTEDRGEYQRYVERAQARLARIGK